MRRSTAVQNNATLLLCMLAYCLASLLHFVHNAVYIHEYPNLPASLTATGVYAAWIAVTSVGAIGYWIYRGVSQTVGLVAIAIYAALGFAGLDHYVVAPVAAHTVTMNATIAIEVATATALLFFVVRTSFSTRSKTSG